MPAWKFDLSFGGLPITGTITQIQQRPPQPGALSFTLDKQEMIGMAKLILFSVQLPTLAPEAADVKTRRLTTNVETVAGPQTIVRALQPGDTVVTDPAYKSLEGSTVTLSLVDIDDANNESVARDESFVAKDTFAPPEPGDFGATTIGQEITP